jgi:hypothetical protein
MGRAYSTHGEMRRRMHMGLWWENPKERDHYEELYIGGRIIYQEVLGRTNCLLSFYTTQAAQKKKKVWGKQTQTAR